MSSIYYQLRERYALRSWADVPCGLADRETGNVLSFPAESFAVLKQCTGSNSSESSCFQGQQKQILSGLLSAGYVDAYTTPPPPLSDYSAYRRYPVRFIRQVHWSITGNCNYRCRHCYMSASACQEKDAPFDEIKKVICQLEECGIMNVSLSGGEALIRSDFWQIIDELIARQITVRAIYSNGFLINKDFIEHIRTRKIHPVIVLSFDGVNGAHDWLRGVGNATEHFLRAVRLIRENGLTYEAEYCLHRGNACQLRESIRFLAEEGCSKVKVNLLLDRGEGANIPEYCPDTGEAYDCFLEYLPQYYEDGAPAPILLRSLFMSVGKDGYLIPGCRFTEDIDPSEYCVCGHASTVMYISASGRVMPCIALDCVQALSCAFNSVYDKPLNQILEGSFYSRILNTRLSDYYKENPECEECEYRFRCAGGCRARASIGNSSDNFLTKDRENCLLFQGGYYSRVKQLMENLGIKEKCYVGKV